MSERETSLLLADIKLALSRIFDYTSGLSFDEFEQQFMVQDAVIRNFTTIGEAISRIPEMYKVAHSTIPWKIIKDFRNRIVHHYFGIDLQMVWSIKENHLPFLYNQIEDLLNSQQGSDE